MSEYRQHAAECRSLAGSMLSEEHREQLLAMAATWERMADERERSFRGASESAPEPKSGPVAGEGEGTVGDDRA